MGLTDIMKQKKTLSELEEEREYNEAEITILEQKVLKKQLENRGAELSTFKNPDGTTAWDRVKNWLKTH